MLYLHYVTKSLHQPSEADIIILHFIDEEIDTRSTQVTYMVTQFMSGRSRLNQKF